MKKQAILLVENTDNLFVLAQFLVHDGWEIISAGNTASFLKNSNIPVTIDKSFTTGINSNTNYLKYVYNIIKNFKNTNSFNQEEITPIDLVCININPTVYNVKDFSETENPDNSIDIKTVSLIRVAAKNYSNVVILTDPNDYEETINQLKVGEVVPEYRLYLAGKALNLTSAYDAAAGASILYQGAQIEFPNWFLIPYQHLAKIKQGDNAQQQCHLYSMGESKCALNGVKKLQGPEIDYEVILNCFTSWKIITQFIKVVKEPFSVQSTDCNGYPFTTQFTPQTGSVLFLGVKNNNPISAAFGSNATEAFWKAYNADQSSYEKAILACSSVIDENTAAEIIKLNIKAIVAPDYTKEAKEVLSQNHGIYVFMASKLISDYPEFMSIDGGLISKQRDLNFFRKLNVVTQTRPTQIQMDAMLMGMLISLFAKSDSSIIVNDFTTIGVSCAQVNKARSLQYAMENAKQIFDNHLTSNDRSAEILVSDSVIHFDERARMLADLGVKAIIQTGGDATDGEFIDFCNEHGISMVFTGIKHLAF